MKKYKGKILVTGCAGFIGHFTCIRLLNLGYWVVGIDNLNNYYSVKLKKHRLRRVSNFSNQINNFSFEKIDLSNYSKLKKLFIKIGNIENDNDFKCTLCNSWSGKNKASLGAHIRNCKIIPKHKDINGSSENVIDIDIDLKSICIEINEPEKVEIVKKSSKKK